MGIFTLFELVLNICSAGNSINAKIESDAFLTEIEASAQRFF